jgi:pyruvate formate lyase activating enzyme
MTANQAVIFKIQRYSIHDGPGIRTTVFLKGCPLRCAWCHNPESWNPGLEKARGRDGSVWQVGQVICADELVREVQRDIPFFDESGGGVTFSGGEPMAQAEFLREVLPRLRAADIHTAVDTSGYAPWEAFESVLPYVSLFLYDIKLMNESSHIRHTGVSNAPILQNLRQLAASGTPILARMPVLPGVNDDRENIEATAAFLRETGVKAVELLPYHNSGTHKYDELSLEYGAAGMKPPDDAAMNRIAWVFTSAGIAVRMGGKTHDGTGP